mgnify:CR=1 FL=1
MPSAEHRRLNPAQDLPFVCFIPNILHNISVQTDAPKKRFENLKRIWDKREVLIVEGSQTRLGVGNDLFANAAGIRRMRHAIG